MAFEEKLTGATGGPPTAAPLQPRPRGRLLLSMLSRTQIDSLGDRLRQGNKSEDDLRLLSEYRESFADAYESVRKVLGDVLALETTGRPAKSTTSIVDKLRRETIRHQPDAGHRGVSSPRS